MLQKILTKTRIMMLPPAVGAGFRRPVLDAGIGAALLKDRRVPVAAKARALAVGTACAAGALLLDLGLGRLLHTAGSPVDGTLQGVGMVAGSLLFAMIALVKVAPAEAVTRLRYERYRIIPLRSPRPDATSVRMPREHITTGAIAPRRYAVIPRRMR